MKHKSYYSKIFRNNTLIISLTILILASYLYMEFGSVIIEQEYSSATEALKQSVQEYHMIFKIAQEKTIQMYKDLNMSKLLFYKELEIYDKVQSINQLKIYNISTPYVHSIYLYNNGNKTVYVDRDGLIDYQKDKFYDSNLIELLNNWNNSYTLKPLPRIITMPDGTNEMVYSIIYGEYTSGKQQNHAVVINLSIKKILEHLSSSNLHMQNAKRIVNHQGRLVSPANNEFLLADLSQELYIKRILTEDLKANYFIDKNREDEVLVSYVKDDYLNWYFIERIPTHILLDDITRMKKLTLIVSLAILIIGLICSYILSKNFNTHLEGIRKKVTTLERENRRSQYKINKNRLKQLMLDGIHLENEEFIRLIKSLDTKLDERKPIRVINMRIDYNHIFSQKNSIKDQNLIRFCILNVSEEMFDTREYGILGIDLDNHGISLIINDLDSLEQIKGLLLNIQEWCEKNLNITISCGISQKGIDITHLQRLYRQASIIVDYKIISGPCSIHISDGYKVDIMEKYSMPADLEEELYKFMHIGNIDKMKEIYSEFIKEDKSLTPTTLLNKTLHMAFVINNVVTRLHEAIGYQINYHLKDAIEHINTLEYKQDIDAYFYGIFTSSVQEIEKIKLTKNNKIITKIHNIIEESFSIQDFCINTIASQLDMSANHIARVYKQKTGQTLLGAIVDYRMEKARDLLVNTDLSASEISIKVGFSSNSYFFRVFKKHHQVTPNEYRRIK